MARKYKLTLKKITAAVEADNYTGFCTACGAEAEGCEPDMRDGHCEECGENKVHGAEELLIMFAV